MPLIRVPIGVDGPVIDLGIWLARALAHAFVAQKKQRYGKGLEAGEFLT